MLGDDTRLPRAHPPETVRPPDPTIEALALAARVGDDAALAELLDRYRPLIGSAVWQARPQLAGSGLDLEDLSQEAAAAFCELVRAYDPAKSNGFGSYVKAMLVWKVRNAARWHQRRRRGEISASTLPDGALEAIGAVHQSPDLGILPVENRALRAALGTLTERQQSVLAAIHGYDLPTGDVAARLGVTRRAVNAVRRRALGRLRELLTAAPLPVAS